jgi:hypothetical protein
MKTLRSRLSGVSCFHRSPLASLGLRLRLRFIAGRLAPLAVVAVGMVALSAPAHAQEEGVAKVRDLNKKAVDAYENLDLEESRKFLMQALEVSATEGLNRHAIKATTHLNLGVVLVGGLKQRDAGIKQFRRALEIDPNVKVPKRLNNPEIQSAFEAATKPEGTGTEPPRGTQPPPVATTPPDSAANLTVAHDAITEATAGEAIDIRAQVQGTSRFEKVVLAYRAEGVSDFLARDMERNSDGQYVASIPDTAVRGGSVSYYIEARGRGGQAIARNGTPDTPHVITLMGQGGEVAEEAEPDEEELAAQLSARAARRRSTSQKTWLSLSLGVGGGWAKGVPEVNQNYPLPPVEGMPPKVGPIEFSNLAPAKLLHITPELGYLVTPRIMLSLLGRLQITTGASKVTFSTCVPDMVCQPATGAVAVLGKVTYLLKQYGSFQPYVAMAAGGGYIRYVVDLSEYKLEGCGTKDGSACFDTVAGGGALFGPAVGAWYNLTGAVYLTGAVSSLVGVPGTMFNVDLNLGIGYRL